MLRGPRRRNRLIGDPNRLRQVLLNLLGNAIKFTDKGEVVLRVIQEPVGDQPGALQFAISDTGIGIPAEKLPCIFGRFVQADASTTRKYGGTGLGLAISKRLVALMGGRIWVTSTEGVGSTFAFTARFDLQGSTPSVLVTQIRPPIRATRRFEMARPNPVPPYFRVVEASACTNRPKMHGNFSAGMPMPVSLIAN